MIGSVKFPNRGKAGIRIRGSRRVFVPCGPQSGRPSLIFILGAILLSTLSSPAANRDSEQSASRDGRWAILLSGVSGDAKLQGEFLSTLRQMHEVLSGEKRFMTDHIYVLNDAPDKTPWTKARVATRENLAGVCRELARTSNPDSLLFLFLIGHGSSDGKDYKLNLVGADPTAADLGAMLDAIPTKATVVVNCTSASGAGLRALAAERRILISATRSGNERNLTRMAGYFVEALRKNAGDTDKDGHVSMLEAFLFAGRRIQEHYSKEGSLQTEHSLLDDNGDGTGHDQPSPENGDGLLARTTDLDLRQSAAAAADSNEAALAREAEGIQKEIEALKYARSKLTEAEYQKRLEEMLIRLAQVNAKRRKN